MRAMSHAIKDKVRMYIKNGLDIADLIEPYEINNLDLSGAKISRFNRMNQNLSNINFSRAVIGLPRTESKEVVNVCGSNMKNCNFFGARILGKFFARRVDFQGSNFSECYMPYIEYQYSDFRGSKLCDTIIMMGSRVGYEAKFDEKVLADLTLGWRFYNSKGEEITHEYRKESVN